MLKTLFRIFKIFAALSLICLLYGFLIEPKLLKVRHVTISSNHYMAEPLRIGFISDIHIGSPHVPAIRVRELVNAVNAENPDVVMISGDYIGGHLKRSERSDKFNGQVETGIKNLGDLITKFGTFSSLGNHDTWYGKSDVKALLQGAGVTVLDNAGSTLGNGICIVGFADFDTDVTDSQSFNDCSSGEMIIALSHSPDSFPYLRSDTVLALAGHTHGGQINLPFIGRRVTSTRAGEAFAYGLIKLNETTSAFVTAGIGTSILPARFRAPPEIVIITLQAAP